MREELSEVDTALRAAYAGVFAPPELAARVRQSIPYPAAGDARRARVSLVPEILDFIAWGGVLSACGLAGYFWLPLDMAFSQTALFAASGILVSLALSATLWALRTREI